jgi:predicted transcriptional regulator of viral defense system
MLYKNTYMKYNISIKVIEVSYMDNKKKLEKLIQEQNGTVLASDLETYNIPRTYLSIMVAEGSLEKTERGIYVSTNSIEDEMFAMQRKYNKLIYSHETALFIHGISDRTPDAYSASVPSGYKVVEKISDKFKIYYIRKDLHAMGVIKNKTSFGNEISVYSIERTICDVIRSRNRMDIQIVNDAMKRFVKIKSVDYSLLNAYARELRIESVLRNYLEVLL